MVLISPVYWLALNETPEAPSSTAYRLSRKHKPNLALRQAPTRECTRGNVPDNLKNLIAAFATASLALSSSPSTSGLNDRKSGDLFADSLSSTSVTLVSEPQANCGSNIQV